MARAIEKGATYLDKLCHKFYDEPKGRGKKTDYVCRLCGGSLETYYCEERLYLVRCPDCGSDVILCSLNGLTYMAYEFSIVCPGCGLETRITYNPSANCCFDKGEAVKQIVEKWNRREAQP